MQCLPLPSSVIRRFEPRMGEKVEESFLSELRRNFLDRQYRAAGRSRRAEALAERGAESELL
jgi:hypothetical protein